MGEVRNKYIEIERLPPEALPVGEYARRLKKHRSYVHVMYDRFKNGFIKPGGTKRYYGADPEYTIVLYHGKPYVIPNSIFKPEY